MGLVAEVSDANGGFDRAASTRLRPPRRSIGLWLVVFWRQSITPALIPWFIRLSMAGCRDLGRLRFVCLRGREHEIPPYSIAVATGGSSVITAHGENCLLLSQLGSRASTSLTRQAEHPWMSKLHQRLHGTCLVQNHLSTFGYIWPGTRSAHF